MNYYAFTACPHSVSGTLTRVSGSGSVVGRRLSLGHSVLSGVVQVGDDGGEVTVATVGRRGREPPSEEAAGQGVRRPLAAGTPRSGPAAPLKPAVLSPGSELPGE